MDEATGLFVAFSLGLFSTLHCWGMCGGIITALSLGLPAEVRNNSRRLLIYSSAYNAGRIVSYTFAGMFAGLAGHLILFAEHGIVFLQWLAAVTLIHAGLRLIGWMGNIALLERIGQRVWQYLRPLGRHLLPIDRLNKACLMGLIWGWLPCGLVYTALLLAATTGAITSAAFFMLAFGIGTLPGMIAAGFVGGRFLHWLQQRQLRYVAGCLLIILGLVLPVMHLSGYHVALNQHATHLHHD